MYWTWFLSLSFSDDVDGVSQPETKNEIAPILSEI